MLTLQQMDSPAKRLSGLTLNDKWIVGERLLVGAQSGNGSGGNFSVSYRVTSIDGNIKAFLKAFDFQKTIMDSFDSGKNIIEVMAHEMGNYQYEDRLNDICIARRFKKIVKVLDKGQTMLDGEPFNIVPFLIMEIADYGDIRKYVEITDKLSLVAKLEYLKDVTAGISQLHSAQISHQDLKPSNIMIFSETGAKIGDLGRASLQGHKHWINDIDIAGDISYAPIEQLYGFCANEWVDRREKCDLYQLGSIICFLMLGTTLNSMLKNHIPQEVAPKAWRGNGNSYEESLPYLEHAFDKALEHFKNIKPEWLGLKLQYIVFRCSHPNYKKRGAIKTIGMKKPILGLDRLVSEFDLLSKKVFIHRL